MENDEIIQNTDNLAQTGNILYSIWHRPLFNIASQTIEVSNIIVAICLVALYVKYYNVLLNWLNKKLIQKLHTDQHSTHILENLIFYISSILFSLVVFQVANLPLGLITVIYGTFAISIGLGAQTFFGNFISGLIIMIERPLGIGDIIQFGDVFGTVKEIGIRRTTLVSPSDVEILIPNSSIVNNTLINWSLKDNIIKYKVIVKTPRILNNENSLNQHQDEASYAQSLITKLNDLISSISYTIPSKKHKVYLIKVEKESFSYLLEFHLETTTIDIFQDIKSELNLILLKELSDINFTIEYTKDTELKNTTI